MTLDPQDYRLYLDTHLPLLYFAGMKEKLSPAKTTFKQFLNLHYPVKFKCREALYKNKKLLDEYLQEQADQLTEEQVEILNGFKQKIRSDFILFKYLKKYAIFVDTNTNLFYAVQALGDPFDNFFTDLPVIINAAILPFKGKIIYDGFLQGGNVHIGRNMTADVNKSYKKAKQQKEIITTL